MARSNSSAILIAPIFLRLALGVIFLWAGLGKFFDSMEVGPADAAILANMGVLKPGAPATPPVPPTGSPNAPAKGGALLQPDRSDSFRLALASYQPDLRESPKTDAPGQAPRNNQPATPTTPPSGPATPPTPPSASPPPSATPGPLPTPGPFTPSDFPEKTRVANVNVLALALHHAANPGVNTDGKPIRALWPRRLGENKWPVYFAWAVAITEVAAGALVLIGLITRVAAFGIFCVMCGALWLTTFGPFWQNATGRLGFFPTWGVWDHASWATAQLQFILFCCAAALMFAGPGALSLDSLTRRPRPKPAPAPPAI